MLNLLRCLQRRPTDTRIVRGALWFPPRRVSVEVSGILFGVPGSLERYSRSIRTQRHIPALHRRGHIAISRTAAVTTNHPTPQALTRGRAQRAQSRPTCIEAVPVLSGCRSLFTPAPVYFMM